MYWFGLLGEKWRNTPQAAFALLYSSFVAVSRVSTNLKHTFYFNREEDAIRMGNVVELPEYQKYHA